MRFAQPEWFFLVPALFAAGWRWPGLRLQEPLRALALAVSMALPGMLWAQAQQPGAIAAPEPSAAPVLETRHV